MTKCFFCGSAIGILAAYYRVKWHRAKGCKWELIGQACLSCGESRQTHLTSPTKPEAHK